MKRLGIVLAILTAVTIFSCGTALVYSASLKPTEAPQTSVALNADTIFRLVNNERVKAGLKPLVRDSRLDASAQAKADDMAKYNYFDHVRDGKHGYEYIPLGMCSYKSENIGMTQGYYSNNTQQLDWWMHSKPHHDAILNANYTLTGVAVNGNKVVQHFCIAK
jgi:uncharacterized protein YkwD